MKKSGIIMAGSIAVLIAAIFFLGRESPHPSEKEILRAARSIPEFVALEEVYGPLRVAEHLDLVTRFHSGYHGNARIVGLDDGSLTWSYYPHIRETIVTKIRKGETVVYEERSEEVPSED